MRRFLFILCVLGLCVIPAAAQTPTVVSGTITDTNGIPYSFARVSAQLLPTTASPTVLVNGNPVQIGGQSNATADQNGTFSMNLFCNSAGGGCSVIQQGGTQWQITVQVNGAPLPLGTGPQTCIALVTVTGASQSVSSSFNACPALLRGIGASASAQTVLTAGPSVGLPFSSTPGVFVTDFFMLLNQNVTFTSPTGNFVAGNEIVVTLLQGAPGNFTVGWPANFVTAALPTLGLSTGSYTAMTFQYCGAVGNAVCPAGDWLATDVGPSGALPSAPGSPSGVFQPIGYTPPSTTAVTALPGLQNVNQAGVTDAPTAVDCSGNRRVYTGSGNVTVTVPTATTLGVPNCTIRLVNNLTNSSGLVTVNFTTWQVLVDNAAGAVSSLTLTKGQQLFLTVDAAGALWDADILTTVVGGLAQTYNVTADQTITAGASLNAIPGLSWTLPAGTALNIPFSCKILYSQATAAASDSFGIQDVSVAPTNVEAQSVVYTSASVAAVANIPTLTTTTATAFTAFTPSAAATVFNAYIDGFIEQPANAASSVFQVMAQFTTNNGTIKRGSACTLGASK